MSRYIELLNLVKQENPARIIEIGTWNGHRAVQMCKGGVIKYVGFDLFEEATLATDEEEKNVKNHNSMDSVYKLFIANNVDGFLVRGNTNKTLPKYYEENPDIKFDFAWIDGGHAVATIENDWTYVSKMMNPGGLVVFDDYYFDSSEENLDIWGCNRLVDTLDATIGDSRDGVYTGEKVAIAWVRV